MPLYESLLQTVYPVGCIYASTVSTSPATLFGFGTWAAYGEGQVLVGKAAAGTFSTAAATGGVETVTLTGAQSGLPAHNHTFPVYTGNGALTLPGVGDTSLVGTYTSGTTGPANAAESHSNLQPYIVVYYFTRTA